MLLDKVSIELLKALYDENLSDLRVNEILERADIHQPDERLLTLLSNRLIYCHEEGEEDPESGLKENTIVRNYSILPKGRAIVEQAQKDGWDKWIDRIVNLLP